MNARKNIAIIVMLAWRNVWKNKRRTILTMLTILVGCAMIVSMNSLGLGGHDQMIEDAVSLNTGHMQIHEKGFWDNQSFEHVFEVKPAMIKKLDDLKKRKRIQEYSRRVVTGALLANDITSTGAVIMGVEPGREKQVTVLHKKIIKGRYVNDDDTNSLVVGSVLAKNMGVKPGDTIDLISQRVDILPVEERFKVVGIVKSGIPDLDRMLVFMPFQQARKLFNMNNYVSSIAVALTDIGKSGQVKDELDPFFKKQSDLCRKEKGEEAYKCSAYEIMKWNDLMPELVQWIAMDDFSLYVFDFILFLIVAFGVLNTIQMSVFERTRELGIMLSIGTTPGQVKGMVLLESFFITVIGVAAGVALGIVVSIYYQNNPIDFSEYAQEMAAFQMNTVIMPAKLSKINVIVTSLLTFVLSFVFTLFPARRAANLEPVKAIRHL